MDGPGPKLKRARERLNLRYRDVEDASQKIAAKYNNEEFIIGLSRLADIENRGILPSVFKIYTLAAVYRVELSDVLSWYGIDTAQLVADSQFAEVEQTHPSHFAGTGGGDVMMPLALDPGVDLRQTTYLSRMIQQWGRIPLMLLGNIDIKSNRYAWIGTEDWSMYPILAPGALIVVDETKRKIVPAGWSNELERPIYFVEHREGYWCAWASATKDQIIFQFHPSSKEPARVVGKNEVDIIGQVSSVAMRLDQWRRRSPFQ